MFLTSLSPKSGGSATTPAPDLHHVSVSSPIQPARAAGQAVATIHGTGQLAHSGTSCGSSEITAEALWIVPEVLLVEATDRGAK